MPCEIACALQAVLIIPVPPMKRTFMFSSRYIVSHLTHTGLSTSCGDRCHSYKADWMGSDPEHAPETPRTIVRVCAIVIYKDTTITAIAKDGTAKLANI